MTAVHIGKGLIVIVTMERRKSRESESYQVIRESGTDNSQNVGQNSSTPHISGESQRVASDNFGAHELGGSLDLSSDQSTEKSSSLSEVCQFQLVILQKDGFWAEVQMGNSQIVHVFERKQQLSDEHSNTCLSVDSFWFRKGNSWMG